MRTLLAISFVLAVTLCMAQSPCDSIAATNKSLAHSIRRQQQEIDLIQKKLQEGNDNVERARKETAILHEIMKGYVNTVDSLNRANQELQRELDDLKKAPR
jgi:septal ring factor EnvC (AmiA/AmiB activator)